MPLGEESTPPSMLHCLSTDSMAILRIFFYWDVLIFVEGWIRFISDRDRCAENLREEAALFRGGSVAWEPVHCWEGEGIHVLRQKQTWNCHCR